MVGSREVLLDDAVLNGKQHEGRFGGASALGSLLHDRHTTGGPHAQVERMHHLPSETERIYYLVFCVDLMMRFVFV